MMTPVLHASGNSVSRCIVVNGASGVHSRRQHIGLYWTFWTDWEIWLSLSPIWLRDITRWINRNLPGRFHDAIAQIAIVWVSAGGYAGDVRSLPTCLRHNPRLHKRLAK